MKSYFDMESYLERYPDRRVVASIGTWPVLASVSNVDGGRFFLKCCSHRWWQTGKVNFANER